MEPKLLKTQYGSSISGVNSFLCTTFMTDQCVAFIKSEKHDSYVGAKPTLLLEYAGWLRATPSLWLGPAEATGASCIVRV